MSVITGMAEVNETKLYYEVMGEGHPLVLIHGALIDRRVWDEQFKVFAEHYRVIRYDVRGYVKSEIPEKPYSHVQDLYSLLNFLSIDKVYVIGLSMGGGIAIDFTLEHPEMVDALIPVSPGLSGYKYSDEMMQRFSEIFSAFKDKGISQAAQIVLDDPFWSPAQEHARQKIKDMITENSQVFSLDPELMQPLSPPAIQRLSEIKVTTLIIAGERDYPDNLKVADMLETEIAGAKKVMIPGTGHIVNMDNPEELNRILLDFLGRL